MDDNIYTPHSDKGINDCQTSSSELSTPVSNNMKCKKWKFIDMHYIPAQTLSRVMFKRYVIGLT